MKRAAFVVMSALILAGVAGCRPRDNEPAPAPAPAAPRSKAYSNPEAGDLGRLPEGVGLAPGSPVPDVALPDADGPVNLRELASRGSLVVVFYRGGWCPFCNFQLRELTQAYPEFRKRGLTPVAISVDRVDEASKTRASWQIPFPVLSDPDLIAHRAFNVARRVDDAEVAKLKSFGMDLEASAGKSHHVIAVPALFIVEKGVVQWAHADVDYKRRPSAMQLLEAFDHLAPGRAVRIGDTPTSNWRDGR